MKIARYLLALGVFLLGMPSHSQAQIRDNDSSMIALAVQCSVSSGYSAEEYQDYCRRLAKTLSLLSSAQQTRVFGYLPMPSGSASKEETTPSPAVSTTPAGTTGANSAVGNESSGSASTDPGLAVRLVRDLNNAIDGTSTSAPVVAGSTEVDLTGGATPLTNLTEQIATAVEVGGTSSGGSNSPGGALISWLRRAEAAYKEGTLGSFLKGL